MNQKGLAPILIVVILAALIGGYLLYQNQSKPTPSQQTTQPSPTPATISVPNDTGASREPSGSAETTNWKTYTAKNNEFSFKYPADWYYEPVPGYESHEVSFFQNGTKADHGYGDHKGNELFTVDINDDDRSLQTLKSSYYQDAIFITVSDKPALKTSFGLITVESSTSRKLTIVGGYSGVKPYIETILSTFKFLP